MLRISRRRPGREPSGAPDPAEAPSAAADGARPGRRRRAVVAVAVGAALVSGGGLAASTLVKSPAQAAADAKPPAASPLTSPVVQRVLANTTVLRGTFAAGQTYAVQPTTVAATAGGPGGGAAIVSAVKVNAGDTVDAGRVLAEVSGRPVVVLPGSVPAYRDLLPDESGDDVAQLQAVLRDRGISTGGDRKGYFGAGTKAGVTKLYQQLGYAAPLTGEATAAAVRAAQQAVQQQKQAVQDLEAASSAATAGPAAAPTDAASGRAGAGGSGGSGGSPDLETQVARAKDLLAQKQHDLAVAQAKDGPELPLSEVLFLPSLPARVSSVGAKAGDKVTGPVVTLTAGGLGLTGHLLPSDASLVKPGMKVTVLSESTGAKVSATVGGVGTLVTPGSGGTSGSSPAAQGQAGAGGQDAYVPVTITPDQPWSQDLDGQDVRITIVEAATSGEVLAVPASAISSGVDGRTTVTVVAPDGSHHPVEVTAGVVADNFVQVTAADEGLKANDQVLVGVAQAGGATGLSTAAAGAGGAG